MKTIPEKIDPNSGKIVEYWILINSLIDVVTEQQKEIEFLESIIGARASNSPVAPYTAMRSTGEIAYCECKGGPTSTNIHKNCYVCSKKIKPQEDVKKRLKTYLTNNIGLNNNLEYITDCILAIVKGE